MVHSKNASFIKWQILRNGECELGMVGPAGLKTSEMLEWIKELLTLGQLYGEAVGKKMSLRGLREDGT